MNLPYLTPALPGTGGVLRTQDDDFIVDEQLPYAASGAGDHVFVRIEKRGMTTPAAAQVIARTLGIRDRDIGIAGMKDRRAVTRQWLSLPPPTTPDQALALALPDEPAGSVRILEAHRHNHKLRTGHVRANRFILRIRGTGPDAAARAQAILAALTTPPGALNWYGEQRFGRDGDNASRGRALISGERTAGRGRLDRLMVSALQSQLFNDWLAARLADGLFTTAIAGDILHKRGGGLFTCDDPATDTTRLTAGELVVTGPMFGERMRQPPDGTPAAAREAQILAAAGIARADFARVRAIAEGTRRDAAIEVGDAAVTGVAGSTLELAFTLPGGAYATAVMREVMKNSLPVDAAPEDA